MRDSQIGPPGRVAKPALEPLLTPVLAAHGLELDALEVIPAGKRRVLRVVVDGDGPAGRGPDLDDIAEATKAVSLALDGSDAMGNHPYTLEVTSRGVGRPLEQPRHWRRNRGRLVTVSLAAGDPCTGRIVSPDDDGVTLDVDGTQRWLAYAEIRRALVEVEFNRPAPSGEED
jgi:ribosome maturation factor RimP